MDEFIADRAAGPPATEQRRIPIEALLTNLALSRLDTKEHRLPFTARFSNAHAKKYSEPPGGKTSEQTMILLIPQPFDTAGTSER